MHILVHGKYRPTSTTCVLFCTQGTVCTLSGSPMSLKVHVTYTYARQVLLGLWEGAHFTIPKLRFNNEIIPASGRYIHTPP